MGTSYVRCYSQKTHCAPVDEFYFIQIQYDPPCAPSALYDHLCHWTLADPKRLGDFNARVPIRYPGEKYPPVTKREDFMDMKESHVIEIAASARLVTTNVSRVLGEKLTRRNMAAHPSDVSTLQPTAEEVIRDLVENVVLKLT